jgi:hypothetical protein
MWANTQNLAIALRWLQQQAASASLAQMPCDFPEKMD